MKKICFIAGAPRSGTTYLNRMLSHHPEVIGGAETHLVLLLSRMLEAYDGHKSLEHSQIGLHDWIDRESYQRELGEFLQKVTFKQKDPQGMASVYLEKTPSNARLVSFINSMFEDALVIHVIRNPVEVVDSLVRASKGWGKQWATSSVRRAARGWNKSVGRACRDGRPMGERYYECTYDALRETPKVVLSQIFKRLGLASDGALIQHCIESANETSDLPEGFVSAKSKKPSIGKFSQWRIRRITRRVVEAYDLPF